MQPLIIIGAGMAGYTLAREFRKLDKTTPMLIISMDDGGFYAKPMLSNALAQNKQAAQLKGQSREQMATQLLCTVLPHTEVLKIDPAAHTVQVAGETFEYSKLVLALGAQPIRLALAGDAADQVMSVNHLDHYAVFRERLAQVGGPARVAILGAGLIGCEFADDLVGAGHTVSLIDPAPLPLAAITPSPIGQALQAALTARGVQLHLSTTASEVRQHGTAIQLQLASGTQVEADLVLSAVGLRADIHLAKEAGLNCERGIVVDPYGQTSVPDVYALGDCAQYTDSTGLSRTMPYIAPIMAAGRALAKTLSGSPTLIDTRPSPVIVKTPSLPIALVAPAPGQTGEWQTEQQGASQVSRFFNADQKMTGFVLAPQEATLRQGLMTQLLADPA
jgi:rubredoxin-NAD+ reductase